MKTDLLEELNSKLRILERKNENNKPIELQYDYTQGSILHSKLYDILDYYYITLFLLL